MFSVYLLRVHNAIKKGCGGGGGGGAEMKKKKMTKIRSNNVNKIRPLRLASRMYGVHELRL